MKTNLIMNNCDWKWALNLKVEGQKHKINLEIS